MDRRGNKKMAVGSHRLDWRRFSQERAKRPCTMAVTLNPLKGVANLRSRYTDDTADVFFVDRETKESFSAHRQLLSVSSAVFFTMFNGDWKEKGERTIPAPEGYKWESFKAAIALLYGEEVEVEESSIPDIYRVAHLYELTAVVSILAQEVCQWDRHLLDTVVELCTLAGSMPEGNDDLLNAAVHYIARHINVVSYSDVARFSYETMLGLVQSEAISSAELVLLRTLNQWTNVQSSITLSQMKQLYSHIRLGTIPYRDLPECSVIDHDNLKATLENHKNFSLDGVRKKLIQITPRIAQKEVFQVYSLGQFVVTVAKENCKTEVLLPIHPLTSADHLRRDIYKLEPAVGIVYCGRQEIKFQIDLKMGASFDKDIYCRLISLRNTHVSRYASNKLQTTFTHRCTRKHAHGELQDITTTVKFLCCNVELNHTGAHLMLQSEPLPSSDARANKKMDVSFSGDLPWMLAFSWESNDNIAALIADPLVLTIHPPTL